MEQVVWLEWCKFLNEGYKCLSPIAVCWNAGSKPYKDRKVDDPLLFIYRLSTSLKLNYNPGQDILGSWDRRSLLLKKINCSAPLLMLRLLIFEIEPSPKYLQAGPSFSFSVDIGGEGGENHQALFFSTCL